MKKKKQTRITLEEVASHAGVSRATASLVARNSDLITEKTREKVLASMRELGYVYDRVAANLRSQSSSTVGLIINEIANPFFSEFLAGVHQSLEQNGYIVFLGTTFDSTAKQELLLSTMIENRVGGVILSPIAGISRETIKQLENRNIPIVQIAKEFPGEILDYVGIDNVYGARIAVEHLINNGHRRISFLGGNSEPAWRSRKEGYHQALVQAGIEYSESYVVNTPVTREGGKLGIKKLLKSKNPPTAVFCYNDVVALGAMLGLREEGLIPGKDIAVIGFDNIKEAEQTLPGLTTVTGYPNRIGTIAAELLHQRMHGLDKEPQRIILTPELVVRDSSFSIN
jgi:LacI family transcriptional regulator